MKKIRVTVWNENRHEQTEEVVRQFYPDGIHGEIAKYLEQDAELEVRTATMDMPENGLTDDVLEWTDVLVWWGHIAHEEVKDEVIDKVQKKVLGGMGLIVLHSGHLSKIFTRMMGTSCTLKFREAHERAKVWVIDPTHPIAEGIDGCIELEQEEMYGEPFDIPTPDELVFINWYQGGEVFRSGCCYRRGYGKIFYFQPGHETYGGYKNTQILKVISNAVKWAYTEKRKTKFDCPQITEPLEKLDGSEA